MTEVSLPNGGKYTLQRGEKLIDGLFCPVDGTPLIDRGLIMGSHSASCVFCRTLYFGSDNYPSQERLERYGKRR